MCNTLRKSQNERRVSMLKFNAVRLVEDCGGVREFAASMGKTRTAPYRMMRTGYTGTNTLALVLEKYPHLNINDYFEDTHDNQQTGT